jgi:hypothetical protein
LMSFDAYDIKYMTSVKYVDIGVKRSICNSVISPVHSIWAEKIFKKKEMENTNGKISLYGF